MQGIKSIVVIAIRERSTVLSIKEIFPYREAREIIIGMSF